MADMAEDEVIKTPLLFFDENREILRIYFWSCFTTHVDTGRHGNRRASYRGMRTITFVCFQYPYQVVLLAFPHKKVGT
jgi:hypothetical protein